jgi:multiple antibiotic resistance protein
MKEFLTALPNAFIPLFVAMDVFGLLPVFTAMTSEFSKKRKGRVVRQSVLTALLVSLAFAALGEGIFGILGITDDDFKIAGGLVLLVFAVLDITRHELKRRFGPAGTVGVVPIGVPLMAGPAVLTTIIVLVDHYGVAPTVTALVLNLALAWLVLLGAGGVVKVLGSNGAVALSKVMSLLLAAIAVMMIRLGVEGILGIK